MTQIGFVRSADDERTPLSPLTAKKYAKLGVQLLIEKNLGESIGEDFQALEGLETLERKDVLSKADLVYSNHPLSADELSHVKKDALLVSFFAPFNSDNTLGDLEGKELKALSMDMIPRSTIAQSVDALSSMASIAGYKAVLLAAEKLPRYFPMMMTAAGTIKPSTVLILGAGVAGLQAIATAKRLGAKVEVFDVRKAVKEEVQSLGAKFVEVEGSADNKAAGGYAIEQTEEYKQKQKQAIHDRVKNADVVITTAQLRGKPAPTLITKDMVEEMQYGSVIIDLAASTGGNCELTQNNQEIKHQGITIIGNSFLANEAIMDASQLLANNIYNYISLMIKEEGLVLDPENEIIHSSIVYPKQEK